MKNTVAECSCGHAYMRVTHDEQDDELIVTLYESHTGSSIWQRLKSAVSYFWTGRLDSGELLLAKEEAIRLRDFLNDTYK